MAVHRAGGDFGDVEYLSRFGSDDVCRALGKSHPVIGKIPAGAANRDGRDHDWAGWIPGDEPGGVSPRKRKVAFPDRSRTGPALHLPKSDYLVVVAVGVQVGVDVTEEVGTVAGDVVDGCDFAFLQSLVWVERDAELLGVAGG